MKVHFSCISLIFGRLSKEVASTGVVEYDEVKGLLVTERWQDRNRRASASLSPVLVHFIEPYGKLYQRLLVLEQLLGSIPPIIPPHYRHVPRKRKTG